MSKRKHSPYKCQQCGGKAMVTDTDINGNDIVVCEECQYEILKDTADKEILVEAVKEALENFGDFRHIDPKGRKSPANLPIVDKLKQALADTKGETDNADNNENKMDASH